MFTRRGEAMAVAAYQTPWGPGIVVVSEGRLAAVELPETTASGSSRPGTGSGIPGRAWEPDLRDREALGRWVEELEAYFRGERLSWNAAETEVEELAPGTFTRAVYRALLRVPAGSTVSYGELAMIAGFPRAARAVGNAMAANPAPVVIPCHRVIRGDGSLGNYGDDPAWKERLLAHEREHLARAGREG